jgi:transcriptional regulator with XRE-family HTH domain
MATAQELKNAKELGRLLQSARQREGMSLASLSKLTGISTARLVALEDGNFYFFINNGEEMNDVAVVYALALAIEIPEHLRANQSSTTAAKTDVFIPYFLRKKN